MVKTKKEDSFRRNSTKSSDTQSIGKIDIPELNEQDIEIAKARIKENHPFYEMPLHVIFPNLFGWMEAIQICKKK